MLFFSRLLWVTSTVLYLAHMGVYDGFVATIRQQLAQKNLSVRAAARRAGLPVRSVQGILEGHIPSIERAAAVADALGLDFYVGPPRSEPASAAPPSTPTLDRFSPSIEMTVRGWARCGIEGYFEGEKECRELPMPLGLEDEDAFYAMALGTSMNSGGIENGDYCVVSPNTPLAAGLRVWLKNQRDQVTIKRLLSETETHYELLGWQDPDAKGDQASYHDQWLKSFVKAKGVILAVYRGRPNGKNPPPLIPDPKPPAVQPKGVRALKAAGAVGQRFTDEALREEMKALRDETREMRAATETVLKEVTSRLPRKTQDLEDDSALAETGSGSVLEFPDARDAGVHEQDPTDICSHGFRILDRLRVRSAAGGGAYVDDETVVNHLAFRDEWLEKHRINHEKADIIEVLGTSMEPTLPDKSLILVDHRRTTRRSNRIFVVRWNDLLYTKRLVKDGEDWLLVSDNDKEYKPVPWPEEAVVIGQVMWTARTL